MTPLGTILADKIKASGPISLEEYMGQCLFHPEHGYYTTRPVFGASGDFVTAPEISQMFGEMLGLWAAVAWQSLGSPERLILAELGPGRGTLMKDALRAAKGLPGFIQACEIWLVEKSPQLRNVQARALAPLNIHWADEFADIPDGPMVLLANEFFDALPIRQFEKQAGAWAERQVDFQDGQFKPILGAPINPILDPDVAASPDGSVAETCPMGQGIAAQIGKRLNRQPGVALVIDYGYPFAQAGDSLQAVGKHQYADIWSEQGQVDLTAHVDFEALAAAAIPARSFGPVPQGYFLKSLGIETRAHLLSQQASPQQAADLMGQLHRLTDDNEMGALFKALCIASPWLAAPVGFQP